MILIENIIVDQDIVEKNFCCDLNSCKGACCWEGDYGAPLDEEEVDLLNSNIEKLSTYLGKRSQTYLESKSGVTFFDDIKQYGTSLHEDGACVYLNQESDVAYCAIEMAYNDQVIDFQKPLSCHLYPIRIDKEDNVLFEKLNYDDWDICKSAKLKGKVENLKIFEFAKAAIIRKYGNEFYNRLLHAIDEYSK